MFHFTVLRVYVLQVIYEFYEKQSFLLSISDDLGLFESF